MSHPQKCIRNLHEIHKHRCVFSRLAVCLPCAADRRWLATRQFKSARSHGVCHHGKSGTICVWQRGIGRDVMRRLEPGREARELTVSEGPRMLTRGNSGISCQYLLG